MMTRCDGPLCTAPRSLLNPVGRASRSPTLRVRRAMHRALANPSTLQWLISSASVFHMFMLTTLLTAVVRASTGTVSCCSTLRQSCACSNRLAYTHRSCNDHFSPVWRYVRAPGLMMNPILRASEIDAALSR